MEAYPGRILHLICLATNRLHYYYNIFLVISYTEQNETEGKVRSITNVVINHPPSTNRPTHGVQKTCILKRCHVFFCFFFRITMEKRVNCLICFSGVARHNRPTEMNLVFFAPLFYLCSSIFIAMSVFIRQNLTSYVRI